MVRIYLLYSDTVVHKVYVKSRLFAPLSTHTSAPSVKFVAGGWRLHLCLTLMPTVGLQGLLAQLELELQDGNADVRLTCSSAKAGCR